jgi:hypothetical protein
MRAVANPPPMVHPSDAAVNYTICLLVSGLAGAITITMCAASAEVAPVSPASKKKIRIALGIGIFAVVLQFLAHWALSTSIAAWSLGRTPEMIRAIGDPFPLAKCGIALTAFACVLVPVIMQCDLSWMRPDRGN